MTTKTKIGRKLRKARKELELTQAEVADKADIHPNYYSRIERDEVNPSLDVFEDILKALKVKSRDILNF